MPPQTVSSTQVRMQQDPEEAREPSTSPASSNYEGVMLSAESSEPKTSKLKPSKPTRDEYEDSESPTRSAVKRARENQGEPKGFMNVPIEVFAEIIKHLYPLELVSLSRVNKSFRQLLMRRSAIKTWRYALNKVPDLPPCPKELCEPQYAALVFSLHCSMCGKQTFRSMDPILQVRLCIPCREQEIRHPEMKYADIVPTSTAIRGQPDQSYYLRKDLDACRAEHDAVLLAHGHSAIDHWRKEQRAQVSARLRNAQPLAEFIKKLEAEQKAQRQEKVEARLLKLGWENGDFEMRDAGGARQWESFVCSVKPLTEQDWGEMLPQLTTLLENNRKLRLGADRARKAIQWLRHTLYEAEPYARVHDDAANPLALHKRPEADEKKKAAVAGIVKHAVSQAQEDLYAAIEVTEIKQESKRAIKNLQAPFPMAEWQIYAWSPLKLLVDSDIPTVDFERELVGIRPILNTLLLEWRVHLEEELTKLLPANPSSVQVRPENESSRLGTGDAVAPRQIREFGILVDGKPFTKLPLKTQSLLRADTVFYHGSDGGRPRFYPDDYVECDPELITRYSSYLHMDASKIAHTLLVCLGKPNATYLQMKAAGPALSCGRCVNRNCVTWREMVWHFLSERQEWTRSGRQRGHIFTHDLEAVQYVNPAVRIATKDDMKTPYRRSY